MRLLADLHTHSTASGHAYSTITELAAAASSRSLECIAITDHGPALPGAPGPIHFWNLGVIPIFERGVLLLTGVEANGVAGHGRIPAPCHVDLGIRPAGKHPAGVV